MPLQTKQTSRRLVQAQSSDADASTSTLRARLCNQQQTSMPPPNLPSHKSERDDMYQRFRACFAEDSSPFAPQPFEEKKVQKKGDAMEQMRESFARAGLLLHANTTSDIVRVHQETSRMIATFKNDTTITLAQVDALYANIAYPLSATLCHGDTLPRATIAVHLDNIEAGLAVASEELSSLAEEWENCVRTEEKARRELEGQGTEMESRFDTLDKSVSQAIAKFREEAESICKDKVQELEEIEEECKQRVHAETMVIMQSLVAG